MKSLLKYITFLRDYKSNVLVLIHDELILEIHEDEKFLIPVIRELMVKNRFDIPLHTGADISDTSWADLKEIEDMSPYIYPTDSITITEIDSKNNGTNVLTDEKKR